MKAGANRREQGTDGTEIARKNSVVCVKETLYAVICVRPRALYSVQMYC